MKLSLLTLLLGINLYCLVLLWGSMWPGRLEDIVFLTIILGTTLVIVVIPVFIAIAVIFWRRNQRPATRLTRAAVKHQRRQYPLKQVAIATALIILVTHISIKLNWPMRVAFGLSEGAFLAQVNEAPVTETSFSEFPLNQRLGLYYVTYYATDSRGGTYFQTGAHGFFPAPHGFAYQPNDQGSPFGDDIYHVEPVQKDWYWFRATWDW
ncbi:MAG: hypothetical protein AAF622_07850 [Cyanobacteria bacterium P01_C01_bin.147]